MNAQKAALSVTTNCCQNLHADKLHYVSGSTSALACRLTQQDKKSVGSIFIAFSRLVDSFYGERERLLEVASSELLANLQQLLVVSPPVFLSATHIMCTHCPELTVKILKQHIAHTLCLLLTGPPEGSATSSTSVSPLVETPSHVMEYGHQVELFSRSPKVRIITSKRWKWKSLNLIISFFLGIVRDYATYL